MKKEIKAYAVCTLDPADDNYVDFLTAVIFAASERQALFLTRERYPDTRGENLVALDIATDPLATEMILADDLTVAEALVGFAREEVRLTALKYKARERVKRRRVSAINTPVAAVAAAPVKTSKKIKAPAETNEEMKELETAIAADEAALLKNGRRLKAVVAPVEEAVEEAVAPAKRNRVSSVKAVAERLAPRKRASKKTAVKKAAKRAPAVKAAAKKKVKNKTA